MGRKILQLIVLVSALFIVDFLFAPIGSINSRGLDKSPKESQISIEKQTEYYWFELHRKSKREFLYFGNPGVKAESDLVRKFVVNTGVAGKKPTPLPELLNREYWVLIAKADSSYDPETSPYFLTLDVPITDQEPYGPANYDECDGQCNWERPGFFGLHGIGGVPERLTDEGSSGCIRHTDEDITFLYNLLDPTKEEIRYYVKDI